MGVENIGFGDDTDQEVGPSWKRSNWPLNAVDDLTGALDPTQMQTLIAEDAKKRGVELNGAQLELAAQKSIRAMILVRTYRVRGHLGADLDPLHLSKLEQPEDLDPAFHGFRPDEMDEPIYLGGVLGFERASVRELVATLCANYCGKVGLEYMHIADVEERRFLQERMEGKDAVIRFTPEGKKAILAKVIQGEEFESFLGRKYVGTKRFGLDGGESMIPALENIIKYGGQGGVREIVFGMAHRGRLNILANVMAKPYRVVFHEFQGGCATPEDVGGSGDVKYHLGSSADRAFDGINVHMSLMPNPSHLEAVDPVVLGKVRAQQVQRNDLTRNEEVLPVLLHGDAAFAGQGIVWECLGFSGIRGYNTGGCIHFVINNQIGFTTSPQFARSSPYPSDVAKGVQAPIFHVNGDDPEAVTFACKIAIEFRQKFHRDIVIDMWCYRRFGHNEGDEPGFTQPIMYDAIRKHPYVSDVYAGRLIQQQVIDDGWLARLRKEIVEELEREFAEALDFQPNKADWFGGRWEGLHAPADPETARRNIETVITEEAFDKLGRILTDIPDGHNVHKTLRRVIKAKARMFEKGDNIDWATGEALAFGSLLQDGYNVRLSGQDSGRGTFSHRHAVWIDQDNEARYTPLEQVEGGRFDVLDSPLSEYGVLGFEYGYAYADPKTLAIWEAQFGDFSNGAQIIIDQFIASGEVKWQRANGLVMLLPHGYEGQGPEHSSARLERFLQLCAEDNVQVANITSPANYFHMLRRQMLRSFRKPLILMAPKSLLRHKMAVSRREDFLGTEHFKRILSDPLAIADHDVKRLVLCSGKVAFDLIEARDKAGEKNTSIVRIEQLYPFPSEPLRLRLSRMKNLKTLVWAQEEPKNMGSWTFVEPLLEKCLHANSLEPKRPVYAGRHAAASPASGLAKHHFAQQEALVREALGLK